MAEHLHVLFVDNFDSFTFNLVDEFRKLDADVEVWRNDLDAQEALQRALDMPAPRLIVLSPGPGTPRAAGCSVELVRLAKGRVPLFGVCLGHQAIVEALGGTVGGARQIVHGKATALTHEGRGLFAGLPSPMRVGRYHSLAATVVPAELEVTARSEDLVMAVEHRDALLAGVQFHPESVLTPLGSELIRNVCQWASRAATPRAPGRTAAGLIKTVCAGSHLSREDARDLFGDIVRGELDETLMTALLVGLKMKGETPEEIAGAAEALRAHARPFDTHGLAVVDTCGTGGDGARTVNISTAAALVAAECGAKVAKHGNRSVSSQCGSADVLEQCGVNIEAAAEISERCLSELSICFLFAPQYHAGIRHAMPVRKKLGMRTIFNSLGPLANPARPRCQVMGVYDPALVRPLAETLGLLGCDTALVVHGSGLDEIAVHGPTTAALWKDGRVEEIVIDPKAAGARPWPLEALRGGDAKSNARWLQELLAGRGEPAHNDAVAINAGAVLWVAGQAGDLRDGTAKAKACLKSGAAALRLQRWAELSRGA